MNHKTSPSRNSARRLRPGTAKNSDAEIAGVRITHPDRVLASKPRLTKWDLAQYYAGIAEWILPHIQDRPLTLVRCPTGPSGECFYQKHWSAKLPAAIRGVPIQEKSARREYVVIDDLTGLLTLIQNGVLEIHPWPTTARDIENPDRLTFDLDPGPGVAWADVIRAARDVRAALGRQGLLSFVRTTGGKGLHVVAPLSGKTTWGQLKEFAKRIALELVAESPDRYVATLTKAKRIKRVFVDYLRNQRGATSVASN